jgi:S1-C subfamily serine protease
MWDRLMGVRAAQLAGRQPPDGVTVLLVGGGHLAYGLGANLQALRASALPQLTVWDARVSPRELDAQGRYPVVLGMADWVRIYTGEGEPPDVPSLGALRLEPDAQGVRVRAVHAFGASELKRLQPDDLILALDGAAPRSPTALRLAFERVPLERPARFTVRRGSQTLEIDVTTR